MKNETKFEPETDAMKEAVKRGLMPQEASDKLAAFRADREKIRQLILKDEK